MKLVLVLLFVVVAKSLKPANEVRRHLKFALPKAVTSGLLGVGMLFPSVESYAPMLASPSVAVAAREVSDGEGEGFCGKEQSQSGSSCGTSSGASGQDSTKGKLRRAWTPSLTGGGVARAGDYDENWSDRQRLAAETWRAVDEAFFDRT